MTHRSRLLAAACLTLFAGAAAAQTPPVSPPTASTSTPAAAAPMAPSTRTPPASPAAPAAPMAGATAPAAATAPAPAATAPAPAAPAGPYQPITAGADLAGTLKASGQFTTLMKVVDATGLTKVLATPGLTVFAPTDAAFAASGADVSDAGLKDTANLTKLQGVLTYHVVNAKIPDFKGRQAAVTAANNQKLYLDATGETVKVNDASALQPAVTVGASTIYPIDKVVSPGFTPPTPPAAEPAAAAPEAAAKTTTSKATRKKR